MSNHVRRLGDRGLVAKQRSDTDLRQWLITLTDAGRRELETTERILNQNIAPALAAMEHSDREALHQGLESIQRLIVLLKAEHDIKPGSTEQ